MNLVFHPWIEPFTSLGTKTTLCAHWLISFVYFQIAFVSIFKTYPIGSDELFIKHKIFFIHLVWFCQPFLLSPFPCCGLIFFSCHSETTVSNKDTYKTKIYKERIPLAIFDHNSLWVERIIVALNQRQSENTIFSRWIANFGFGINHLNWHNNGQKIGSSEKF